MQINMKKNNFKITFFPIATCIFGFLFLFLSFQNLFFSQTIVLSGCRDNSDSFANNDFVLDFKNSLMTRNFTYRKDLKSRLEEEIINVYRHSTGKLTIATIKKSNSQLLFEENNLIIKIKTLDNNGENIIKELYTCDTVQNFEKKSF